MTFHRDGPDDVFEFRLDPSHTPGHIDWTRRAAGPPPGQPREWARGAYRLVENSDRLDLSFYRRDGQGRRPTDLNLVPARGSPRVVLNLTRERPKEPAPVGPVGKVRA